ncbi:hypothetical protein I316_02135 [Kwoniella heveanensis BCC8398]|uniref:CUE domain-containing protein n=1 Tax=Kwoniella heveanensis BCC8398 TaxID=1296120 RepID=A0A1B9GZ12_9TREE|nr:hypothetical protein I316_02135 [Kwoniella heveanensis BCC8398]
MSSPPPAAASATSPHASTTGTGSGAGITSPTPAKSTEASPATPTSAAAAKDAAAAVPPNTTAGAESQSQSETTYAPPHHPPPSPQVQSQPRQIPADPKVAELRQIFPNVELSVIELVLETCGGSTDRAIEQLLGMTDPDFRPDELGGTREDHQVDLDAEFARSLQLADEEEYRHRHRQNRTPPPPFPGSGVGGGHAGVGLGSGELPYQPRVRRARGAVQGGSIAGGGQSAPTGAIRNDEFYAPTDAQSRFDRYNEPPTEGNPPGMLAFEEKVERFAEAGKQTFNSLLSRARAKYSEFQEQQSQNRANQNQGGGYRPENLSPSGDRYTRPPSVGGGRGGEQNRAGIVPDLRHCSDCHRPSIRSESISSESTYDAPPVQTTAPIRQGSHRWQPSDAFDDPLPPQRSMSGSSNRIEVMGGPAGTGSGRRSPGTHIGSPEKTTGKIDPAKLGILPKKRVDLMSTSPSNTSTLDKSKQQPPGHINVKHGSNDDDDDDPNPSLPNAPHSLVSKIPPTPPATDERYSLGDSDDELEYTK